MVDTGYEDRVHQPADALVRHLTGEDEITAAPKLTAPMSSAISCPRTATQFGSMRVIAVVHTALRSASLMRLRLCRDRSIVAAA